MRFEPAHACHTIGNRQRGVALIILLVLLLIGVGAAIFAFMRPASQSIERDKVTAAALAQAKAALIGYAMNFTLATGRPGDLPCPDLDNDGSTELGSCGNAAGTTGQALRLGRLPWKTLGLPDLRDGDGERLWYAVSNNFKNNTRTICSAPGQPGCLNSDSSGTITIRDRTGATINAGSTINGVIAVVLSPGSVLQRQGAASPQDRSCAGDSDVPTCNATRVCSGPIYASTALCDPANYLDIVGPPVLSVAGATDPTPLSEDNARFTDSSIGDGFINGRILDVSNNIVVNDRLLTITYQDLMPLMERRVAKEVLNCLTSYAGDPQNNGHYPWAADIVASGSAAVDYGDVAGKRAGRIPDTFAHTATDPGFTMKNGWSSCNITIGSWWSNWKELVFYAVADAFKPVPGSPPPAPVCPTCLTVNLPLPASPVNQVQVVAIVAGKMLGGQSRSTSSEKGTPANYLENDNDWLATGPYTPDGFTKQPVGGSFNDYVLYR